MKKSMSIFVASISILLITAVAVTLLYFKKPTTAEKSNSSEASAITSNKVVTITIESWRSDDAAIWEEKIIPAFEKKHPNIKVKFLGTLPSKYDDVLDQKLANGTAGDIITCRPFDKSLALYKQGHLLSLKKFKGMDNFSDTAKSGWVTDNGKDSFCLPMASVIHGFFFNGDVFAKYGYKIPTTHDDFFQVLEKIKTETDYIPMVLGLNEGFPAADLAYNNIGPNYWKGETGRKALIAGDQKLTDEAWTAPYRHIAKWAEYLGEGFATRGYPEAQELFTSGQAVIYPTGSWEISKFRDEAKFSLGLFLPPVPKKGDQCYVTDHIDIGLGINKASANIEEVKTFLKWASKAEFANIYGNSVPGFFPLSNVDIELDDPYAKEFLSWRKDCETTIRSTFHILSRGTPGLEIDTRNAVISVLKGEKSPEQVTKELQENLDSWYKP